MEPREVVLASKICGGTGLVRDPVREARDAAFYAVGSGDHGIAAEPRTPAHREALEKQAVAHERRHFDTGDAGAGHAAAAARTAWIAARARFAQEGQAAHAEAGDELTRRRFSACGTELITYAAVMGLSIVEAARDVQHLEQGLAGEIALARPALVSDIASRLQDSRKCDFGKSEIRSRFVEAALRLDDGAGMEDRVRVSGLVRLAGDGSATPGQILREMQPLRREVALRSGGQDEATVAVMAALAQDESWRRREVATAQIERSMRTPVVSRRRGMECR